MSAIANTSPRHVTMKAITDDTLPDKPNISPFRSTRKEQTINVNNNSEFSHLRTLNVDFVTMVSSAGVS